MIEEIKRVLVENGLTDRPDLYDGNIHSWRCAEREHYGPCNCFESLARDLEKIMEQAKIESLTTEERTSLSAVYGYRLGYADGKEDAASGVSAGEPPPVTG